jgi:preprotein translocase subunit SecA
LLEKVVRLLFGDRQAKLMKSLEPPVERITGFIRDMQDLDDGKLQGKTREFRERLARGETLDDIMCEAFAAVSEACRRNCGNKWMVTGHEVEWAMVPFRVQLKGAIVLHRGMIAEMATGEGKTLVAVMPMYLNALELNPDWVEKARESFGEDPAGWTFEPLEGIPVGSGAHLVTVNDYLARRDAEWMGPIYGFLGLTVGCIQGGMDPDQRRAQYNCDITYGTNNEFGFDYLRDNMAVRLEHRVQRAHHYAIVDEVDSVLIDEARTPLIISGPVPRSRNRYQEFRDQVARLVNRQTDLVNAVVSDADELWEQGETHSAATMYLKARRGAPKNRRLAKTLRDPDKLNAIKKVEAERLRDKNINELDEGLCFSIDERERSVAMSDLGRKILSPENPDFFLLRDIGDEVAEIEARDLPEEEKFELRKKTFEDHSQKAEALHNIDQLLRAFQLYEKDVEYVVQEGAVIIVDQFTGRLMPGRRFSDGLHEALEAKEKVEIRAETQTLATITIQNYFRMYAKLSGMTGTAETEAEEFESIYKLEVAVIPTNVPVVRTDHNDRVYRTKREKYTAIIEEIQRLHRRDQPVLVGTVSVDVSEVLSKLLKARKIPHSVLNAKHHQEEADIVARAGQPGAVTIATNMAGRGTDIKLSPQVREVDDGRGGKESGGLFVIGTERHESRRIDRQLRGRSGRQGDPGGSRFYMSLEDDLFRLFASEKMIDFLKRNQEKDGEPIEHPLLNRSIQQAQKRVEQYNFGIRKHLLEYDDVTNRQREVVYGLRFRSLTGEGLRDEIRDMIASVVTGDVESALPNGTEPHEWNTERAALVLRDLAGAVFNLQGTADRFREPGPLRSALADMVLSYYDEKERKLGEKLMVDLEKWAVLSSIDSLWREHLYSLDHLKTGIGLRSIGQRDPLVEFKKEAFGLFEELQENIDRQSVRKVLSLWPAGMLKRAEQPVGQAVRPGIQGPVPVPGEGAQASVPRHQPTVKRDDPKVGRNDPCPCGSGRKYKKCCGAQT